MSGGALALPEPPEGLVIPEALVRELADAYARPQRAYHVLGHAFDVARRVLEAHAAIGLRHPREAYVAALFHDAVYDASRKDNEAKSAELACEAILRHGLAVDAEVVRRLVLRTAEHGSAKDLEPDEALFLDCDTAVLGGSDEDYDRYERGVAEEYRAVVPSLVYRFGRRRFLERMLASERIFHSDFFRERLEARARANLRRTLGKG
ncbi:MAG: hypothetical protein U0230_15740 [Polyangiales bacterium]